MGVRNKINRRNLMVLLGVLGPGIIVSMVDNDAGGIATYSVAGARYGYSIIWVMIPTVLMLYMVQEMNARMGIVTGKGLAALIRERFSLRLTALIMLAVIVANFANTISEFAGVAASSEIFHISKFIAVPVAAVCVWFIVLKGSYKRVEKVFLLVGLIYGCYIVSAFLVKPDWGAVSRGALVPSGQLSLAYIIIVITVIGTTVAPWMQFYQQAAVVDKGLDVSHLNYERIDTAVGNVFLYIASVAIIICCAAAFFNNPHVGATRIETADQAARALAPIAGNYASYLFAAGLLFASVFAASILPLSTAYTVCEAFGWEAGIDRSFSEAPNFYLTYTLFIAGGALFVMIPKIPLITVMLISQTVNGVLLPVVLTCMLKIIRDRDIMGDHVNGDTYNTIAWIAVIVLYGLDLMLVMASVLPSGH
jgi:NRAMP (natural resistance-associated macrophage protein)-like metal ion transporter